ncbi:MAG: right-handed parallel beta-helix repeat-containing protein [Phycisphaerales bacterium]|jgi:hypothetical protein
MTIYYVSSSLGADGWPGTFAQPWQTLNKVETEFVAGTFLPGDRIRFRSGDTWILNQRFRIRGCSGTAEAPIVLEPYLEGARPEWDLNAATQFVGRYNADATADYITLDGFEIHNVFKNVLMHIHGCTGWTIQNCYLYDAVNDGGWAAGMQFRYAYDAQVLSCKIGPNIEGEGIYIGNAGDHDDNPNVYMRDLYVTDCENEGLDIKEGKSNNCSVIDSVFDGCGTGGQRQIALGGSDHLLQRVRVIDTDAAAPNAVRIGGFGSPNYSGRRIILQNVFISGPSGGECIRLYGDENTINQCTLRDANTGIDAWSAGWTPHASQTLSNIAFDNGLVTEINYVSDPSRFIVFGNQTITVWYDTTYYNLPAATPHVDCGWRPRGRDRGNLRGLSGMRDKGRRAILMRWNDDYVEATYDDLLGLTNAQVKTELETRLGEAYPITVVRLPDNSFTLTVVGP